MESVPLRCKFPWSRWLSMENEYLSPRKCSSQTRIPLEKFSSYWGLTVFCIDTVYLYCIRIGVGCSQIVDVDVCNLSCPCLWCWGIHLVGLGKILHHRHYFNSQNAVKFSRHQVCQNLAFQSLRGQLSIKSPVHAVKSVLVGSESWQPNTAVNLYKQVQVSEDIKSSSEQYTA